MKKGDLVYQDPLNKVTFDSVMGGNRKGCLFVWIQLTNGEEATILTKGKERVSLPHELLSFEVDREGQLGFESNSGWLIPVVVLERCISATKRLI